MRDRWPVWVFVLLLLRAPAAAAPLAKSVWEGDDRAQQKVAVTAEGLPVGELLGLITERTGIALSTEAQIAETKIVAFGPARPLRELLDDLAALFNATWVRYKGSDGSLKYHLERGESARRYEARLAGSEADFLRAQLEKQVRALDETPVQLARRPENDPIRAALLDSNPDSAVGTRLYSWLTPEQQELLFRQSWLRRPWSSFSPTQQAEIEDYLQGKVARENQGRRDSGEPELAADDPRGNPIDRRQEVVRSGITFILDRRTGFTSVWVYPGVTTRLVVAFPDEFRGFMLPAHGNPYTREAVPPGAPLPSAALSEAAMKEEPWVDRLRRVAEISHTAVLADYYRTPPVTEADYYRHFNATTAEAGDAAADGAPSSPTEALDALCQKDVYLWWVRGQSLLFRKRDWFTQQLYELPDRWMLDTISRLRAQEGIPTVDNVLRLRELTIPQLAGLYYLANRENLYGEVTLFGLQELLWLVEVSPRRPRGALPVGWPAAQVSLVLDNLSPVQETLLEYFLDVRRDPSAFLAMGGTFERLLVNAGCLSAKGQAAVNRRGYRYTEVGVVWYLNVSRGEGGGDYTVYLPLSLADNRRDQTRVELAP